MPQIKTKRRLTKEQKKEFVAAYHEKLLSANFGVLVGYAGLKFHQIKELRDQIKEAAGEFKVVKNRLLKLAAKDTVAEGWAPMIEGAPKAVILAFEDPVPVAKAVVKFAADNEALEVVSGFLGDKLITPAQIKSLATLPPLEALRAQFLGLVQSPQRQFVSLLASVARNFVYLLRNYADKLEKAA